MNNSCIQIKWNGHSCFTVSANGYSLVLDPYGPDVVPGLGALALTADQIFCSHEHSDHGYRDCVKLRTGEAKNPFTIQTIDTFHDDQKGSLRGTNRIHVFEYDSLKIAHLGDLGCSLTDDQLAQLKNLDAVLIPVGGYYTIDAVQAKELVKQLTPRVVIPMHYRSDALGFGYPVIGQLEEFTKLCDDVVTYESDTFVLDKKTTPQTAVLTLQPAALS